MVSADALTFDRLRSRRTGSFILIALAHAGIIWMLMNGLLSRVAVALRPAAMTVYIDTHEQEQHAPQPKQLPFKVKTIVPPVMVVELPSNAIATASVPLIATSPASQTAASPKTPVAALLPRTITADVEYVRAPRPEYPPLSRRMKEEGKVVLRVLVNEYGHPQQVDIQTSSGSPRLDEAARKATLCALFKPHTEDGRPVAVYAMVPISFTLS